MTDCPECGGPAVAVDARTSPADAWFCFRCNAGGAIKQIARPPLRPEREPFDPPTGASVALALLDDEEIDELGRASLGDLLRDLGDPPSNADRPSG